MANDDWAVQRGREKAARDRTPRDGRPELEAAHAPYVYPDAATAGNCLRMLRGRATPATTSPVVAAADDYGVFVAGAPLIPGSARVVARKAGNRWAGQNDYCPCGPCHPQRTLTLSMSFRRADCTIARSITSSITYTASGPDAATVSLPWDRDLLIPAGWGSSSGADWPPGITGAASPYRWAAAIPVIPASSTATALTSPTFRSSFDGTYPFVQSGFGVGLGGLFPARQSDPTVPGAIPELIPAYIFHAFELYCSGSGYTLVHTMQTREQWSSVGTVGGSLGVTSYHTYPGPGYRMVRRGTVASGTPFSITFPTSPDSYTALDGIRNEGASLDPVGLYRIFDSGQAREPRYIDHQLATIPPAFGAYSPGDVFAAPPGLAPLAAADQSPPFGVYEISIG